ncbi:unnamed protein product [Mesocestoides corti]|uniref:Tetraspanin n=1 Tax=Mesocestoides corti TaxID=53468 RepID=A0A0R3UE44_MESCO|nr:unnamed protein product [Mesocestoides corti]
MALTCGEQFLRILLVVCNLFVFLFGCVCTGFAAYTLAKVKEYTNNEEAVLVPAFILALVLLIMLIGFLGCCGAWKLNACCLKTYAVIITILIIIEVICGTLILVYHHKGCADAVYDYLRSNIIAAGVTAIVLSIIEIGAVFAACCLANKRAV